MDKTSISSNSERETHDFMNVQSFSQLPFIRPTPVREKGIRLFGIEFGGGDAVPVTAVGEESEQPETNDSHPETVKETENGDNSRRFECHYCFRNFPTSQALGGHQNAHKRERQHAKRQNLQTAMVHSSFSDAHHIYGLMNYRIGSSPSPAAVSYSPWNANINGGAARFYGGGHGSYTQTPINGSPLGMWRIPAAVQSSSNSSFNRDRPSSHHSVPLFAGDHDHHHQFKPPVQLINGGGSSSQSRYAYEPKQSVQDQVSLDLHL